MEQMFHVIIWSANFTTSVFVAVLILQAVKKEKITHRVYDHIGKKIVCIEDLYTRVICCFMGHKVWIPLIGIGSYLLFVGTSKITHLPDGIAHLSPLVNLLVYASAWCLLFKLQFGFREGARPFGSVHKSFTWLQTIATLVIHLLVLCATTIPLAKIVGIISTSI